MNSETGKIIQECLKYEGGRSRPDKSMPFILPLIAKFLNLPSEANILDVGCGRGSLGRIMSSEFDRKSYVLDGIDIHREYFSDEMAADYSFVIWGDMHAMLADFIFIYNLFIFMDILEHTNKNNAVVLIRWLNETGKHIIASIPNAPKHWHQEERFERANPHEAHLHNWTDGEVERDLKLIKVGVADGLGVYASGNLLEL